MKGSAVIRGIAVWLATVGVCLPQTALAATPSSSPTSTVNDVSLREGGKLLGQVVDPQGTPLADVLVSLSRNQQELATSRTDASGCFGFRGLSGGVYHLAAAKGHGVFRAWAPGTAPPAAQPGSLIVAGRETVRGQMGSLAFWLSNPWVLAAIVGASVAIPVAIHNSKTKKPSSP